MVSVVSEGDGVDFTEEVEFQPEVHLLSKSAVTALAIRARKARVNLMMDEASPKVKSIRQGIGLAYKLLK